MKIYNKKGFFIGCFWLIIGIAELILFLYRGFTWLDLVFCVASIFLGITYLGRSLSRNMSDADQDERTQLIIQKTKAAAFQWTKILCIFLAIMYLICYTSTKNELHLGLSICFCFLLIGMMIIEAILETYYDRKL